MPRTRVFVDTNVIIEAFRTGCWAAIFQRYAIETVEKCIEEALTGDPYDPSRVTIDRRILTDGLAGRHVVSKLDLAKLALSYPHCQALDDGEFHLLAWLHTNQNLPDKRVAISTADKAAIVAVVRIGWGESLSSLEKLAKQSGVTRGQLDRMARHYRTAWLEQVTAQVLLGVIP